MTKPRMKQAREIVVGEVVKCGGRWRCVSTIDTIATRRLVAPKRYAIGEDVVLTMSDGTTWQATPDAPRRVIPASVLDRTVDEWDQLLGQVLDTEAAAS